MKSNWQKTALALMVVVSGHLAAAQERLNLSGGSLFAAAPAAKQVEARLVLSATTARPGDTITAGVQLRMQPGWHTYWKNPGASGMPTKIEWQLPPGIRAGEIQWPLPEKYGPQDLVTYVYHDEVVLLVPLSIGAKLPPGPLRIHAAVSWLQCKEVCIPGGNAVSADLVVSPDSTVPSPAATLLETWRAKLPRASDGLNLRAAWTGPANADTRTLHLEWLSPPTTLAADFLPYASEQYEIQSGVEHLSTEHGTIQVRKHVKTFDGNWPAQIAGVLVVYTEEQEQGFEVTLRVGGGAAMPGDAGARSLWGMLLYALLGGLILNVMPCVLPVIALKILGFLGQAQHDPRTVRRLGLIYTAGVLASFFLLALIVIGIQTAGQKAGWGFQFGNPYFIVAMTTLVTLIALNLFGLFEVTLGGGALTVASELSGKHGAAGAFFNGLLATILATSCTAPVLGVAVGFAFAQPPAIIVLMMLTVGVGLALPYLVLSWQPTWLRFLPKPGPWMNWFKILMGVPMLAAALWLLSLAETHYGDRTRWLAVFLAFLAASAWIYGRFVQRGNKRRVLALGVAGSLLLAGYVFALEGKLHWRAPQAESAEMPLKEGPDGIDWQRWSPEAVASARAAGRPVLVDFTARWCLTCQANKKFALEIASVREKLKAINAVALLGDYTRFPPDITEELQRYQRAGVPLVLVYPSDMAKPPLVLPEALTPGIVLEALEKAATRGS